MNFTLITRPKRKIMARFVHNGQPFEVSTSEVRRGRARQVALDIADQIETLINNKPSISTQEIKSTIKSSRSGTNTRPVTNDRKLTLLDILKEHERRLDGGYVIDSKTNRLLADTTIRGRRKHVDIFMSWPDYVLSFPIGKMESDEDTNTLVDYLIQHLVTSKNKNGKHYTDLTISGYLKRLKSVIRYEGKFMKYTAEKLCSKLKYEANQGDVTALTENEIEYLVKNYDKITSEIDQISHACFDTFIVGIFTGARVGDIKTWTIENLSSDKERLSYCQSKSRGKTWIKNLPLPVLVREIFERNIQAYSGKLLPDYAINPSAKIRQVLAQQEIFQKKTKTIEWRSGQRIEKVVHRWEEITMHVSRATMTTSLLMMGVPEQTVKSITGHSKNSAAFGRYVKVTDEHKAAAMDKMAERFM